MQRLSRFRRGLFVAVLIVLSLLVAACTEEQTGPDTTGDPTDTTIEFPVSTTLPDLGELELAPEVRAQLEDLIVIAQEIRELPFLEPPTITVVDEAGLRARILELLEETEDEVPADEALYKLLGLLDADADLDSMLRTLYSEQVAGFYDGRNQEIVVPATAEGFSILQQGTLVHELVHALGDQHFGFDEIRQEMVDEERYDEATAFRALIEGDASYAELLWFLNLPQNQRAQFLAEAQAIDSSVLLEMPRFIRESLLFPYESGMAFVQHFYQDGGWGAVNDLYRTMPDMPGSTEQIIAPADYGRDLPVHIAPIPVEIPGYELVTTSVWGELGFRLMFDQVLGGPRSFEAADGWGGDFYHQWFDGTNAALLIVYTGDTEGDIETMRTTLLDYQAQAVPGSAFVWVAVREDRLFFILADEPDVGITLRSAMGLDD